MVRTELAFDLRFARRWVFFYGLGYEWALKTSRSPIPASECFVSGCPPQYQSGKGQVTSRVGFGLTFAGRAPPRPTASAAARARDVRERRNPRVAGGVQAIAVGRA